MTFLKTLFGMAVKQAAMASAPVVLDAKATTQVGGGIAQYDEGVIVPKK